MSKSMYTGKIGLGAAQKIDAPIKAPKGKGEIKPQKATGRGTASSRGTAPGRDIRSGK